VDTTIRFLLYAKIINRKRNPPPPPPLPFHLSRKKKEEKKGEKKRSCLLFSSIQYEKRKENLDMKEQLTIDLERSLI
jgi:hypothetical protein